MQKGLKLLGTLAIAGTLLTACSSNDQSKPKPKQPKIQKATTESKGWETFGFDYANTRHVPYNLITQLSHLEKCNEFKWL